MKIVHINWGLDSAGAENLIVDMINVQVAYETIALIIINNNCDNELLAKIDKRCDVYRLDRASGSRNALPFMRLNYILWAIKPDVIHIHQSNISRLIPASKMLRGSRICLTAHNTDLDMSDKEKKIIDMIFAISGSVQRYLRERLNVESTVIYNGVRCDQISVKTDGEIGDDVFRIVQVSRLNHEIKGQDILIRAVSKIKNQLKIQVDFIGDGSSRDYLEQLVEELDLRFECRFLGARSRAYIYSHLKKYDLFVQPSLHEGFGLTVAEALAAKLPALVSDCEGPMEIIEQGRHGFHFKRGDASDCAEKMIRIYHILKNENMSERINQAYASCLEKFDINRCSENYLARYRRLATSCPQ